MKFSDIAGNKGAIQRIKSIIDADRIPHALLLSGSQGIGKLAIARAMAQYIHCNHHINGDSCGVCPSCLQHQTFNHADLHFVFPVIKKSTSRPTVSDDFIGEWRDFLGSNKYESFERWLVSLKNENSQPRIYVHESESIIHKMSLASYSSRYKIMIIWLPEKLMEDCANKLLKIIEEPYPDTLFILVSDFPKEILPTIYSRTQRIELNKLSSQEIAQELSYSFGIDYQDALAIAAPADGDMVSAQEALALDGENKQFFQSFVQIMRMAYSRDIKGLKNWSDEIAAYKREKEKRFMQYCARMLRENFIYNFRHADLNYLTREEEQFSKKFAPFINDRNVEAMIDEFNRAENDILRNANAKIVLFDMALRITKLIRK